MTNSQSELLARGANNLLVGAAGLRAGERVLIVHERASLGWYDQALVDAVTQAAKVLGANPSAIEVGAPDEPLPAALAIALTQSDCTVYLARIGDQDRFAAPQPGSRAVMVYARDAALLASDYGTTEHQAMVDLKMAIDQILSAASHIEITCADGTHVHGAAQALPADGPADVSMVRFPMGVPAPLLAAPLTGRVALTRYLAPTGSRYYEPAVLELDEPVIAVIEHGRILDFEGPGEVVTAVHGHYKHVGRHFGIDEQVVHSWHAGIHPACHYAQPASANPDRWANTVFQSPRFVHFHTCGDYAPGEICWTVADPTIMVDGMALWENGRLTPQRFACAAEVTANWPVLDRLFRQQQPDVGL